MDERERFMPRRVGELTADLADRRFSRDPGIDPATAADDFRSLSRVVTALVHVELLELERDVTEAWEAIDDDPDAAATVAAELHRLVERAHYVPVSVEELDAVLEEEALVRLRLEVHLDDYDDLHLFRRGARQETFVVTSWRGRRQRSISTTVDDRVVMFTRVKPDAWFEDRGIDPRDRGLDPGTATLKLFRDVPRADVEMLLPATRVRFRRKDTLKVGVPAVASALLVLTTKLLPTLGLLFLFVAAALGLRRDTPRIDQDALILLFGGFFALGLFLFRQWKKLENRRIKYLKVLNENLYFRMVADGAGVLHTLYASAEEQEVAEILLAYRFLLDAPEGLTGEELDHEVEAFLADSGDGDIDFDVEAALATLARLGLLEAGPRPRAVPIDVALGVLDARWQALFRRDEPTVTVVSPAPS